MRKRLVRVGGLALCWLLLGTLSSAAKDDGLAAKYQQWLDEVDLIISPDERRAFLALREDPRRDAFIEQFWRARDSDPSTPLNDFRERYYARREEALARFRSLDSDPARIWILNGEPGDVFHADCGLAVWPLEIWSWRASDRVNRAFSLLFYRPAGGSTLELWSPTQGYHVLQAFPTQGEDLDAFEQPGDRDARNWMAYARFFAYLREHCLGREEARRIIAAVQQVREPGNDAIKQAQTRPPIDLEWLASFADRSTDLPGTEGLSAEHRRWLDEVALLISPEERRTFLALPKSYQREGFIAAFWRARDPDPGTEANELRSLYLARRETAIARYGSTTSDQARVYILNGEPAGRWQSDCSERLWPIEVWHYEHSDRTRSRFNLLFYRPNLLPYRLWRSVDGYQRLVRHTPTVQDVGDRPGTGHFEAFYAQLAEWCGPQAMPLIAAMRRLEYSDFAIAEVADQPLPFDSEWLASFRSFSTELSPGAPPLDAQLAIGFPARHQSRTVLRGTLLLPAVAATAPGGAYTLTGEVLRAGALHESFRYVFQVTPADETAPLPLVFDRPLRPGDYHLVLKLEENGTARVLRLERDLTVPSAPEAPPADAVAAAATNPSVPAVRLLTPATDLLSGVVRLEAEVGHPAVHSLSFSLDGKPLLARQRPPWTVELRIGELPRSVRVRAVASDAHGEVLGADELLLNAAPHRFAVRLIEPRDGTPTAPLRVRAEVRTPEDRPLDRLELFLDETPVATLYQPPWETVLPALPDPPPLYLRALAHLPDGGTAEDAVLLAGGDAERGKLEVDLVEVYASVEGTDGRPTRELGAGDFTVREDGRPQQLLRFRHVTEVPLHVALLVDTSASMAEMLPQVQHAAVDFFSTLLAPGDRAAVFTFSEEPRLAAPFGEDLTTLTAALVGLRAERGTALWDSLVHALHYFQGIAGKRALIVFSDGADRGSRFRFEDALAYAQHTGVAVYAVSFGNAASGFLEGRRRLARVAEATGGRAFVLNSPEEVAATYQQIEQDLRSQYLLVYQSDGEGPAFRTVDVRVSRPGHLVRAMRGYLP
jgi:VWFA-related protein